MNFKYPKQFTMDFIAMWRDRECLWKKTHPYYWKRHYREKAYDEMLEKLREIVPKATKKMLVRRLELYRLTAKKHTMYLVRAARYGSNKPIIPPQSWTFPLLIFLYEPRFPNLREICASVGIREEDVSPTVDVDAEEERRRSCRKRSDDYLETHLDETEHHRLFEELIAMYRTFPCLWRKLPDDEMPFPDRERTRLQLAAKQLLLDKLREIFPQAIGASYRLARIRRQFKRELTKFLETRAEGREYKPKLWCFNSLMFLAPQESGDLFHLLEEHEIDVVTEEEEAAAARATLAIMERRTTQKKLEDSKKAPQHPPSKMTTRLTAKKEFQNEFEECIKTGPIFGKPPKRKRSSETEEFADQVVEEIVVQTDENGGDDSLGGDDSVDQGDDSDYYGDYADSVSANGTEVAPSEQEVEVLYTSASKPDPLSKVKSKVSNDSDTRADANNFVVTTTDDASIVSDFGHTSKKIPWWKRPHQTKEIVPMPTPTPIKRERPSARQEWPTPAEEPPRSGPQAPPVKPEYGRESGELCQRDCSSGDRYDAAGRLLAVRLRHLDAVQRIRAEKLIGDVLYHAELGSLDRHSAVVVAESIDYNGLE